MGRQAVPELHESLARVLRSIGRTDAMMEMDFDFSPASFAVFSQPLNEELVVLLGREEVGVPQRIAIGVTVRSGDLGVPPAPLIHAPSLLILTRIAPGRSPRNERWLEVIGYRQDEVKWALRFWSPRKALPPERRHPPEAA